MLSLCGWILVFASSYLAICVVALLLFPSQPAED